MWPMRTVVYTVGNELFFEADADVFGSSSPLLSIDSADSIILPEYG